jgi:hypothetical protein
VRALRPLNLKTVADAVEMHESTVSRVTSNKYVSTPRGVFELKYFFSASIPAVQGGESHSAEAVRHRIKDMIDAGKHRDVCAVRRPDRGTPARASAIDIARQDGREVPGVAADSLFRGTPPDFRIGRLMRRLREAIAALTATPSQY